MRVKAMYNQYNYLFTIYIAITSLKNIKIKMKVSGYVKLSENRVYSCHNEPVMTCLEIDNNHFITGGFDRLLGKIDNSKDDIDAFTYVYNLYDKKRKRRYKIMHFSWYSYNSDNILLLLLS